MPGVDWVDGAIAPAIFAAGAGITTGLGWIWAQLANHGTRMTKIESALQTLFDAIGDLGKRTTDTETAHTRLTETMAQVSSDIAVLNERSVNNSTVMARVDARLEKLFEPAPKARARVPRNPKV